MLGGYHKDPKTHDRLMILPFLPEDEPGSLGNDSMNTTPGAPHRLRMGVKIVAVVLIWLLLVGLSLIWNLQRAEQSQEHLALETARSFFELLVISRRWNARHGGVYVPVTRDTRPNPYLDVSRRDIPVDDDLTLTMINPAFMTRQLGELATDGNGVQFHITSLDPLRPANAALPWEATALRQFEDGVEEVGHLVKTPQGWGYRYMAPLVTEEVCLKCHGDHGYEVGSVRGGISVTLPTVGMVPTTALVGTHGAIALVGIGVILILGLALKQAYARLRQQAVIDALTTIPNRRFFIEQLVHELRRGRREKVPLSLIICDIDYFKRYNDSLGHQAGDRCLVAVAKVLRESLRRGGDFCARYGGEEFVVVLPNTPLGGAMMVAETIRRAVSGLGLQHPQSPSGAVTISSGVACDSGTLGYEGLIRAADEALYRAKDLGRDRVECAAGGHDVQDGVVVDVPPSTWSERSGSPKLELASSASADTAPPS